MIDKFYETIEIFLNLVFDFIEESKTEFRKWKNGK